jgi:hypothetical protein
MLMRLDKDQRSRIRLHGENVYGTPSHVRKAQLIFNRSVRSVQSVIVGGPHSLDCDCVNCDALLHGVMP